MSGVRTVLRNRKRVNVLTVNLFRQLNSEASESRGELALPFGASHVTGLPGVEVTCIPGTSEWPTVCMSSLYQAV